MSGYLRKMARKQMKANRGLMNRVVREHEDVLQNIEAILVTAYRQTEEVDDAICHQAIESHLTGQAPPTRWPRCWPPICAGSGSTARTFPTRRGRMRSAWWPSRSAGTPCACLGRSATWPSWTGSSSSDPQEATPWIRVA